MMQKIAQFLFGLWILLHSVHAQDINNDVEIISGKEMPLPALPNNIGASTNGYYGPDVSWVFGYRNDGTQATN